MGAAPDATMVRLWQAVVLRAVIDALGGTVSTGRNSRTAPKIASAHADAWLRGRGADMCHACALAGLDPDAVRDGYLRAAEAAVGAVGAVRRRASPCRQVREAATVPGPGAARFRACRQDPGVSA